LEQVAEQSFVVNDQNRCHGYAFSSDVAVSGRPFTQRSCTNCITTAAKAAIGMLKWAGFGN